MVQPLPSAQGAIQFQYLAEIAVGTTARVDLCRATAPRHIAGKLLAVKRLHQHIAEDPSFANQFLDEVWMTASLKHPNVVEVAGWGQDDDGMYLAVELVQGVSMARLMKTVFETGEAFTERMVVYIASRLCAGLATAHSLRAQNGELLQLVHRDLTPGNVLVGFNGDVKITDFGLAKAKQRLTKTLTGLLKGQPAYMSPEQARGLDIDHRTDLFSLGVFMFELFSGRRPWLAASDFDAVQAILTKTPDDLRDVRPRIDKELAAVVQRCLEKNPASRFQNANEIQARLDEWLLVHGYQEDNEEALARFVRRNAMRQMHWFERAVRGDLIEVKPELPKHAAYTGQNPRVDLSQVSGAGDESEATDATNVDQMVSDMHQRASDPRAARRIIEDGEYSEEIPTIVQSGGGLPLPPKAGAQAAARGAPAVRPAAGAPPIPPGHSPIPQSPPAPRTGPPAARRRPVGVPPPNALHNPPVAARGVAQPLHRGPTTPSPGPGVPVGPQHRPGQSDAPGAPARARSDRPPLPDMRGVHESIIDEDSDARTTAVKAPPKVGSLVAPPIIYPPQRESIESINDAESEEVPTLPIQGVPAALQRLRREGGQGSAGRPLPGQIAPPDPRAPPPPGASHGLSPSDAGDEARGPMNEERLYAEADRFALEAVRFGDEAKLSAARAERQAMIAKMAGDAAAIAVEAVRIGSAAGIAEAARRLDDAYALERNIQRLASTPLDVAPSPAPPGARGALGRTQPIPPGVPTTPGLGPPREPDRPQSFSSGSAHPAPMMPSSSGVHPGAMGPATPAPGSLPRAIPPTTIPMPPQMRTDSSSALPAPQNTVGTGALEAFEAKLRPTIFGLPGLHVAVLAIGTFFLVLFLMWIILG